MNNKTISLKIYQILIPKLSIFHNQNAGTTDAVLFLFSNILLDELDKELERRGHKFCRYADDCNIYIRSERAGKRVLASVENFLEKKLKFKINHQKNAVAKPQERKFLGFSFTSTSYELKIKLSKESLKNVKYRIKRITRRARRIPVDQVIEELNTYLKGWLSYYRLIEASYVLKGLDCWIRRRMRCFVINQWIKKCSARYKGLRNLGVSEKSALSVAFSRKGPWVIANMKPVKVAMPNSFSAERGLLSLSRCYDSLSKMT